MTEYKGNSGTVTVDGDYLILDRKGFGAGSMGWRNRRIPIAAVREVMWQDVGTFSRLGYIHFVLGERPLPTKTGHLAMTSSHPETFDFKAGKQAKAFAELRAQMQQAIESNRAAGIDPATIPFLSAQENATQEAHRDRAEIDEKVFGGKSVTRAELGPTTTNEEMIAKLMEHHELVRLHSLNSVLAHVAQDEKIQVAAVGSAVAVLTDQRVLVVKDELGSSRFEEIRLGDLTSVAWDSRVLHSGVAFHAAGREIKIKAVSQGMAQQFIDAARQLQSAERTGTPPVAVATPPTDVLTAIQKLADLRDAGVVTEDEFAAKKTELLGRL